VVDHYFPVMEELGRSIEELEEAVLLRGDERTMHHLLTVKSRLLGFRRAVRPQAEALTRLMRDGSPWVGEAVLPFFRDTLDHCNQCIEIVDTYRELVTGLLNTHLSVVSNRTNEVMKVLTIIASIFIPLTLLAGIYGMNFDHMPELHSRWAYPSVLAVMLFAAGFMLLYFRRKGWIGRRDERDER
jgi:magnesium transporter